MLKVLHVVASYLPAYVYGGPIYSVSALAEKLTEEGASVTVYTTTANGATDLDREHGRVYDVHGVPVRYFKRITGDHSHISPGFMKALWVNCRNFDVVHIHGWWNTISLAGALICKLRGVPYIVSARGSLSAYAFEKGKSLTKRMIHQLFGRRLLRGGALHVTSAVEKVEVIKATGNVDPVILPNVLKLPDPYSGKKAKDSTSLALMFLGRIHPKKNIELILRVMHEVSTCDITLDVVGDGEQKYIQELKELAHDLGVSCRWHGAKTGDDKYRLLARADVLVLLSFSENFANVVPEALSQGTAVWISDQVGLCDYVRFHDFGWVDPVERERCVQTLRQICDSGDKLGKIAANAPLVVRQDFSSATPYLNLYRASQTV